MSNNAYGRKELLENAPREIRRCHDHHCCDCIAFDRMYQRCRLGEIARLTRLASTEIDAGVVLEHIRELAEGRNPAAFFKSVGVETDG